MVSFVVVIIQKIKLLEERQFMLERLTEVEFKARKVSDQNNEIIETLSKQESKLGKLQSEHESL